MNPEDAIRRLRSADRWTPMEPRFLAPDADGSSGSTRPPLRARSGWVRPALVGLVVLAVLAVGSFAVLRSVGGSAPARTDSPAPTPTSTPSPGTVGALPHVAGRVVATWTDRTPLPATGTFQLHGDAMAITFTCTGGGRLRYSVVGHEDAAFGCSGVTSGGPDEESSHGRLDAEQQITVHVSVEGHPRFALRLSAVPVRAVPDPDPLPTVEPTGPGVPASLRTCSTADFAPTASFARWPHFEGGLVTVRSAAATDCAIRSWPVLRYVDAEGAPIGGAASRIGDESSPIHPVRLAAHGTAYVQIELFRLTRLTDCGARPVASLRLDIGRATVRVPVPAEPAVGKCTDPHTEADGVGVATAFAPTGP